MKITKKTEKEILRVIEDYWDSYFRGDLNKWASYLPEDYRNIGTTKAELWNSKKEIVDFTESVIDQTVGMAEVRDKKTQIIPYEPYVMVHELGDLYVKAEEGWVYYAQFRLSSLLEKNADGWKILHQHGSYPDAKTDEGEAFGFDELKVENKKLRDAIKSRTIELEQKNRDLEIESALERVRAVAMSMKNSKELQAVSEVIFKELITLGFSDLRNTEIIINQDEKQSILSYYYSDYGVSGEIEVDYTSHPVLKKWADDMKTAGDGFASVHISEEEMEGWKQYRLDLGYLPDPKLKNAKSLDYYSYSTGLGALSISSFEPINEEQLTLLERFRNVFGLAYRRYADVVQAEAQAREAKIEAALERVRARSMAMHKSDELGEVIQVVFDQLVHVGFFVEHTGFIVDYKNNEDMHIWLADPKGVQPEITIPYFDAPHWNSFLKAKEKGLDFFANHLDFKEKNRFYRKLFKFIPGLPQETIDFYLNCPGLAISTVLLEDVGLYIENFSGTPYAQEENEILMRFGKVFQQAYTRFLDLQKAEAQAREAQIEAALERVRSRTMAMHQSKELTEVVSVMYENMEVLGLAKWGCAIIICREETEQFEFWLAELTASNHTNNYFVKGKEHPVYRKIWDHWEAQGPPLTLHHQDEYKREFDEYWLNKTDFRNLPDEVKASVFDKNEVFLNYATMRHGLLNAISFEQPSNELMEGLDRFAKVFEQTYTRFLDLEKAEAQARESQIEASLDRIRAASMAMHNSEELSEVGQVFLNQIEHLAIPLFGIAILVVDEDTRNVVQYMVDNTRKGQEPTLLVFEYKIEDFPVAVEGIELLKKGKTEYTITSGKKKIGQWVAWVKKYMGPERAERLKQANLEKVFFHTIHFHGLSNINFTSLENLSTEKWSVMRRLVATFARSYRRFLDLQKAEAQAREAQVEAALERVRARAMAMHVSSELSEVVAYLYREFNQFGMGDWGCNIMIFNEEKDQIEIWLAESDQRVFDDSFKNRTKGHTFIAKQWDIWRKQKDETVALSGKVKRSYDDYVLKNTDFKNLPVEIKAQIRSLEEVHFSFATMQYGMLAVIDSNKGLSDSEKAILKRFAKVFQQTYTRFLDLQKAEAQAREAQIEAALERVRSRTMAMHKSEELQEVVKVLYEQLTQVGLLKQTISIALCEPATHTIEYWLADYTSTAHISSYQVKGRKNHVFRRIWRAWKAKESTISFHLSDKSKKKFDTYLFEETGFKELPPIVKKEFRAIGSVYITCVNMNYGYLEVANNHSMPRKDVSIVQKFAKVFEQTYTRFLDLQKAEAQAREAQIEAALERVRARTMAMHKSSELADATNVLFDQIRGIGLKAVSGWITIVNPEEDSMVIYLRTGDMMGTPTKVSGRDHVNFRAEIDSWKKGAPFIKIRNPKNEFVKQVKRIFGVETEAPKDKEYFHLLQVHNKYGFLGLGMWAEAKEEEYEIYRRFTKVFEQTYTRFLDLQKAEAQAQEAQIEVALERVRAQTMAMHQSDELRLVTATVFEQLRELGFDIPLCGFIIYDKESGDSKHLLSGYGSNIFPEAYHVPRFDHPYLNTQWNDWKEGESFKGYVWEGALKQSVDEYYFKHTDFKKFPPKIKKQFKRTDHIIIYDAFMSHGALEINSAKPISEKQKEILQRFARVFEQTYTRFLDLQKAEAQAREAQMETTLERIRAASMAMQHSDELPNMALQFLTQLELQDVPIIGATINVVDEEKQTAVSYFADNTKEKDPQLLSTIEYEIKNYWAPRKVTGEINKGANELTIEAKGKQINNWIKWIKETLSVERAARLEKAGFKKVFFHSIQIHNSSSLTLSSLLPLNEEHWTTVRRMAKTFVLSYQRFIDLQKAEAQAREARIEAALERVRAASMAMHKSSELPDVALVLDNQLTQLNIQKLGSSILMLDGTTETYSQFSAHGDLNGQKKILNIVQNRKRPNTNIYLGDEMFRLAKAGEKDFCILLKGEDLDEFIQDMIDHVHQERGQAMRQAGFECVYFYFSVYHGISPIVITTLEPLPDSKLAVLRRMATTFGMSYRRFLDLQKAEAQAREAEIEAALERVRSATMAMHQSSDLHQAAGVLFEQLSLLGAELFTCGFVLCEDDNPLDEQWMYARNTGKFVTQYIPHEEERVHFNLYKAWKAGTPLYSEAVEGQELEGIIKFLMAQPSVQKNLSQLISEGVEIPKFQKLHGATFSKGYLLIITTSHFSEEQIFTRFAKVFEQTYTRFLDLQRAEAQAREAQIEAALERVRAQTMAMHNSEDVGKSIVKMFEELTALGVPESTRFGIGILNQENTNNQLWTAKKIGEGVSMHIGNLDMNLHPLLKSARKAWEKQVPLHKYVLEGEDLLNYYRMLNNAPDYELKVAMDKLPEREIHYGFIFDHGFFYAFSPHEFETELIRITQRFSALFAQTYRRYLDLVKAEAQAREAEIELALERVRAKTMAMHNSEELLEMGAILFKELSKLGIKIFNCGYVLMDDKAKMGWNYGVNPGDGTIRALPTGIPQSGTKVLDAITENWKKQEPLLVIELNPQETIEHQTYIAENAPNFPMTKEQLLALTPERLVIHTFNFKQGYLLLVDGVKLTTDQQEMVMRFANVFEMTYRRFLDLKKAEAQAREAQIEAAVERVRAEAMAMHSSEDFNQTAAVLWEQVNKLEVTGFTGAGIALFEGDGYITWYDFSSPGNIGSHEGNVNRYEYGKYPLLGQEVWEVYQRGEPYFVFEYDLPKLKRAVKEWEVIKPSVAKGFKEAIASGNLTQQWGACGRITNGFLFFDQLLPPDEDSRNILLKMTGAFELAYQRFLDLQKAEAQAREKEIQLGLEKVRARAMAMRHSDELADLVKAVFDELTKLDIAMQWCMINIIDEATRDNTIWAVNPDVDKAPQSYDIRFGDWPYHQASFKAYQERKTKFVYVLEGKEKEEFEEFMFNETDVANISDEAKAATRAMKRYVHSYSFSDFGGLQTVSETPLSEESLDILARFGKVFDLTYTRFNDLKKAEAQAREAQIESAMERVRARAMAMQKADELVEVATLLRKEMGLLGVEELETSSIYIHNKTTGKTECWYAIQDNEKEENLISDHMHIDLNDTWVGRQMLQFYQSDETKTSILMQGSNRTEWINYCAQHSDLFSVAEFYGEEVPERTYHLYKFSNGYMGAASPGAISDESWNLLQRATKVFSLAYTRFSDLQMAEAQAREAQIELALERGRTQSMLMQHSDELSDVSNVFHEQLLLLGLPSEFSYVWLPDEEKMTHMFWATWSEKSNKGIISRSKSYTYPLDKEEPYTAACYEMWESEESVFVNRIQANEVEDFFSTWAELVSEAKTLKAELFPDGLYYAEAYMKYGCFGINIRRSLSKEEQDILLRFSVEFERAYTRFLDLKKAEAQTREAQIEAALERVRAQTMAMHDSEDVGQCIIKLFSELITLGVSENTRLGIGILNHDNENMELWTASKDDDAQVKLDSGSIDMSMHPLLVNARNAWKENRRVDQYIIDGKEQVKAYFQIINTMPDYPVSVDMKKVADRIVHYDFSFEQGILYAFSLEELSEEMIRIFQRFSALFGQTYRRFLDLQKAEAQAREAKIEAALERVRSRTMAMHKAEELHEVVTVVVEKLVDLGVVLDANGVILCTYFKDSRDVLHWIASPDFSFSGSYLLPYFDHPIFSAAWESKLNGDDYFSKSFTVEEKNTFFEYAFEHSDYKHFPEEFKQWVFQNDKHSLSFAWSEHSAILIPSHTGVLPSDEDAEILKRFAKVFEQAYVRFMDLQKAEKQAKEALKQAALDRVRGEIASMRSTEDLNRITPVIWRELIALNVPFIRCGVFIVNEEAKVVEVYLTTPEGAALGVLNLPFDINSQTTNTVKYWREKAVYREHWDAQAFTDWTQSMIDLGQVKEFADYQGASKIPEELHLHFIPFKQGMLYVGDVNILPEEKIEMVKTLAEAFSIAYARYEDFVRLEQAKSAVEVTLEELKSTQAQLIQSEKMASLGELTAGIAHEIQNPLNFVNNFSEVSDEILDEMIEEIEKGDLEEVKAIAADIKQNLQKINHHGKRADAIVKGMLQHSRKSSGEKTPTDINLLADEYLRLAYHGLRAKDKSFNATLNTDFDTSMEKVLLIPQDIGRVLLNLFNNAFYAINEKKGANENGYQPTVTVRTRRATEHISIAVEDNGNGIPQHVIDKVFQPFFTTKPTGQGTGLGLSMSYDIVKSHGGTMEITTEDGVGTTFTITIPNTK